MLSVIDQQNITSLFTLDALSPDEKEKLFASLEELSLQATLDLVLDHLDTQSAKQFLEYIQSDETGEKAVAFAKERIPLFETLLQERMQQELNGFVH